MCKALLIVGIVAFALSFVGCRQVPTGDDYYYAEDPAVPATNTTPKETHAIPTTTHDDTTDPAAPSPPVHKPALDVSQIAARPRDVIGNLDMPITREWKYIVIHHSGGPSGNIKIFDAYHKSRGWDGIGYDFVIGNGRGQRDGAVEATYRWKVQKHGAHAGVYEYNQHGIGICLVGDFNKSHPTQKQLASLVSLIAYLQQRCHIPASHILGHRQVKMTDCPGRNFPYYEVLALAKP